MPHTNISASLNRTAAAAVMAGTISISAPSSADPLGFASLLHKPDQLIERGLPDADTAVNLQSPTQFPSALQRRIVGYPNPEAPGTIIIDTPKTYLYLLLGNGKAIRYGIGVGRDGFTWSGVKTVERKAEWPDWIPPAEMLERQPYLPRFMAGGPGNPLGARAIYLSGTVYRIHGTNDPSTIGKHVSSGCIRMRNEDIIDLYARVNAGAKVIVLPDQSTSAAATAGKDRSTQARPARTAVVTAAHAYSLN